MTQSRSFIVGSAVAAASLLSFSSVAVAKTSAAKTPPTLDVAACSSALDQLNTAFGPASSAENTAQIAAQQTRLSALKTAIALTDTTQRKTAVQTAEKAYNQARVDAARQFTAATKPANDAIRASCGGLVGPGSMMPGKGPAMLKEKLEYRREGNGMMKGKFGRPSSSAASTATQ